MVIAAIIGILWTYHTNSLYEQSFTAQYRYQVDVDLETGSSINNLTLYVTLPFDEGKVGDGRNILENVTGPEDWKLSTVDTKNGKMLKISAMKM